jgi:hypothetical protein
MPNTTIDTDTFWETDLKKLEEWAWVNLPELMLKANAAQRGWIQWAEKIAKILRG